MGQRHLAVAVFALWAGFSAEARAEDEKDKDKDKDDEKVTLAVDSDDARVLIERRANVVEGWQTTFGIPVFTSTEQWEPVCAVPCKLHLSPHAAFRVSGRGIAPSHEFLLPKGNEVHVDAHARSSFWYSAGIASTIFGALFIAAGAVSTGLSGNITSTEAETQVRSFGVVFLVTGAVLLGVGVPLWLTGRSTVTSADGRSL